MLKNRFIIAGFMVCLILAMIPSVLSATPANNQGTALQANAQTTAPAVLSQKSSSLASVTSNIATSYWLELKTYPSTNTRALWLYAGDDWRYLSNPSSNIESSVQQAFANPNTFEVKVWYSGSKIVGLVVKTK
jgi:hypothetical protein